uniref:Predicted transcriptional regulator, contains HTH domain n=1 Tax=Candidatus Kentrum sp. LFY TaxID=2126342 RepID=A0A450UPY0_9GAMM|nr:MAG: Predicted transcriptional regulator, contains HTH domain [Candidatus Kentron sp. LFY]
MTSSKPPTDEELLELLEDIESDRVERKASIAEKDKIRQAVCAFANDMPNHELPGVIFIGVTDDGQAAGIDVTDQLLLTLSEMRSDGNILPLPAMTVQKRTLKGRDVAVVVVQPADAPPVRLKGNIYIRVGPRRAIANSDEERRLNEKRRYRDISADIRPLPSAPMDTLDELLFRRGYLPRALSPEAMEQNRRSLEHQLIAARFAHPGDAYSPACPTVLGELVIGKKPTHQVPCALVQFVRFEGNTTTDPIQIGREFDLPLPDLLRELEALLEINIHNNLDITSGPLEVRYPDYPLAALQQIVRNAILHRSYEHTHAPVKIFWFADRVEIYSPGGPFGRINRENFGTPGEYDYRNPNLAVVLKELDYIQRFGVGIDTARRKMEENGNPPLEFRVEDSIVTAIFRKAENRRPGKNKVDEIPVDDVREAEPKRPPAKESEGPSAGEPGPGASGFTDQREWEERHRVTLQFIDEHLDEEGVQSAFRDIGKAKNGKITARELFGIPYIELIERLGAVFEYCCRRARRKDARIIGELACSLLPARVERDYEDVVEAIRNNRMAGNVSYHTLPARTPIQAEILMAAADMREALFIKPDGEDPHLKGGRMNVRAHLKPGVDPGSTYAEIEDNLILHFAFPNPRKKRTREDEREITEAVLRYQRHKQHRTYYLLLHPGEESEFEGKLRDLNRHYPDLKQVVLEDGSDVEEVVFYLSLACMVRATTDDFECCDRMRGPGGLKK